MIVTAKGKTHAGRRRLKNETDYGLEDVFWVICDGGMAGGSRGDVASQLAVDAIRHRLSPKRRGQDEIPLILHESIQAAQSRLLEEGRRDPKKYGMRTLAIVAALCRDRLFFANVGSSRGYISRAGRFVQMTRDDTLLQNIMEAGELTAEEAESHSARDVITQAVGAKGGIKVSLTYAELRCGDVLFLCSPGLTAMVREPEIARILADNKNDPQMACDVLVDRANAAGGEDDITVIVAKFEGEDLPPPSPGDIAALARQTYVLPLEASSGPATVDLRRSATSS